MPEKSYNSDIFDTKMNIVVAAPAGSGKTEKLARRYISLLKAGNQPERILAITFTEKAAAEMKERILKILRNEYPELYLSISEKIFLMRIQTIHSFCLTLLRRFSFEMGLDPNFEIMDPADLELAGESIASALDAITLNEKDALREDLLSLSAKLGWNRLKNSVRALFDLRPASLRVVFSAPDVSILEQNRKEALTACLSSGDLGKVFNQAFAAPALEGILAALEGNKELFLTEKMAARKKLPVGSGFKIDKETYNALTAKLRAWYVSLRKLAYVSEMMSLYGVFARCREEYDRRKKELDLLDFNDLEYLTHRLITEHKDLNNVLLAFDEQTDHILVDEFQDTNYMQWNMLDRLTEEWHSGLGQKRDAGVEPTLFIVGDMKQSIYGFRNASVEIFDIAAMKMQGWYGKAFRRVNVTENYRCGDAIVDFVNSVFKDVMKGDRKRLWMTAYEEFAAKRGKAGKVKKIFIREAEDELTASAKAREAENVAKEILAAVGKETIFEKGPEGEREKLCAYSDITILMRKRTYLPAYEKALSAAGIPFVVVGGLGFHQEPEVIALRSLLFFLAEPSDDFSLYLLLTGDFFRMNGNELAEAVGKEGLTLFEKLGANPVKLPLSEALSAVGFEPLNVIIERFLKAVNGAEKFPSGQAAANISKFVQLVQEFEKEGRPCQVIRAYFEKKENSADEPKASLNTEQMDAVKLMTVHKAKGLEFPVVFAVGLEEESKDKGEAIRIREYEDGAEMLYLPDPELRREDAGFAEIKQKQEEEEKRVLYVSLTRARDILFLSGVTGEKSTGLLKYIPH